MATVNTYQVSVRGEVVKALSWDLNSVRTVFAMFNLSEINDVLINGRRLNYLTPGNSDKLVSLKFVFKYQISRIENSRLSAHKFIRNKWRKYMSRGGLLSVRDTIAKTYQFMLGKSNLAKGKSTGLQPSAITGYSSQSTSEPSDESSTSEPENKEIKPAPTKPPVSKTNLKLSALEVKEIRDYRSGRFPKGKYGQIELSPIMIRYKDDKSFRVEVDEFMPKEKQPIVPTSTDHSPLMKGDKDIGNFLLFSDIMRKLREFRNFDQILLAYFIPHLSYEIIEFEHLKHSLSFSKEQLMSESTIIRKTLTPNMCLSHIIDSKHDARVLAVKLNMGLEQLIDSLYRAVGAEPDDSQKDFILIGKNREMFRKEFVKKYEAEQDLIERKIKIETGIRESLIDRRRLYQ